MSRKDRESRRTGSLAYVHRDQQHPVDAAFPVQYFPLASSAIQFHGVIVMINENCELKQVSSRSDTPGRLHAIYFQF